MPTFDKLRQINVVKAAVRAVNEASRNTLQGRPYKGFLLGESRRRNKEKALVYTYSPPGTVKFLEVPLKALLQVY